MTSAARSTAGRLSAYPLDAHDFVVDLSHHQLIVGVVADGIERNAIVLGDMVIRIPAQRAELVLGQELDQAAGGPAPPPP